VEIGKRRVFPDDKTIAALNAFQEPFLKMDMKGSTFPAFWMKRVLLLLWHPTILDILVS